MEHVGLGLDDTGPGEVAADGQEHPPGQAEGAGTAEPDLLPIGQATLHFSPDDGVSPPLRPVQIPGQHGVRSGLPGTRGPVILPRPA